MTMPAGRQLAYYVHHVGSGHTNRACALAAALGERGHRVTGLSSGPRPSRWPGDERSWVMLERDDDPEPGSDADVTAHGRLHWAPLGHDGMRRRMAALSAWLEAARPAALVSDVSQEVTLLSRLHGVPVVSVLLPGRRDDAAHALGLGVSEEVVAFWPEQAHEMSPGLPADVARRVRRLGGQSRFAPTEAPCAPRARHLVVLAGTGGGSHHLADAARAAVRGLDDWTLEILGDGSWVPDPFDALRGAQVVLTHAGQNAVAEVAAARVPAVVVPQERPFDEQLATGAALRSGAWPAVVASSTPGREGSWPEIVQRAALLDGSGWSTWVDGAAPDRFVAVVESLLGRVGVHT